MGDFFNFYRTIIIDDGIWFYEGLMSKITVSISTFNEIASILEKKGQKLGENATTLTLDKGDFLAPEHDLRMATIRGSVAQTAATAWKGSNYPVDFIKFVDELYNYILTGKTENDPVIKSAWKED